MTRPTPRAHDLVSEQRMVQLMSQWAQAADASITAKLVELEERLRAELTVVQPPKEPSVGAELLAIHHEMFPDV